MRCRFIFVQTKVPMSKGPESWGPKSKFLKKLVIEIYGMNHHFDTQI